MRESSSKEISALARGRRAWAVELRRSLHRIPETAWTEIKTSALLQNELKRLGIPFKVIAKTGILAELKNGKGKCVAFRTDIDALPITEQTGYSFRSLHPGNMHACGHDVHMATITLAAALLIQLREKFCGTVKFIYQPAEESPPGGAEVLVKAGVLKNPAVDMIFALHVDPLRPVGRIGIREGTMCAGTLDFDVLVRGKGGHGAYPHLAIDPIVCTADLISSLQTIVARDVSPFEPAVVTVGKIESGTARNVIPDTCRIEGTARSLTDEGLKRLAARIKKIANDIAEAHKCKADVAFTWGYPPLVNAADANERLRESAIRILGRSQVDVVETPSMGGEDFAHFVNAVPGAMFWLGVRNQKIGAIHSLHHPQFRADEAAITIGASLLAQAAIDFLNG